MIDTIKEMTEMGLHDVLTPSGRDTQIMRVPGGWVYTLYHPYEVVNMYGQCNTECRATSVFVPENKED